MADETDLPDWIAVGKRVGVLARGFNTSKFIGFGRVERLTATQIIVCREGAQERYQRASSKGIGAASRLELVDPTGARAAGAITAEVFDVLRNPSRVFGLGATALLAEVTAIRSAADKAHAELTALIAEVD